MPHIKKFYKTNLPKNGNSNSNTKLKFKKQKIKKDPLKFQKSKTCLRRPQIKKFYKTNLPTKWEF